MKSINKIKSLGNRERKFLFSSISNFGLKGVSMLVGLLSLPIIYKSIGTERYGMMLSITSVAAVINFADLGLGFGLQNQIPKLILDKSNLLHRTISSTFFLLSFSSIIVFCIFCIVAGKINWATVMNLHSILAVQEATTCIYIFAFLLCVSIPFSIVQKIQIGLQEGYNTNIWSSAGSLFGLLILVISCQFNTTTPLVILSVFGTNTMFIVGNFMFYFFVKRRDLLPNFKEVSLNLIKSVLSGSFYFFWVQLLALLLFVSNNILLVHYSGPEKVTEFNIAYKLLLLFMIPIESSAPYITPVLNEAAIKGENTWIKKSISKGLFVTVTMSLLSGVIVYFMGNIIIGIWIGQNAILATDILLSLSFYLVLFSGIGCILSYIMLSNSFIKIKSVIYTIAVIITVLIKVIAIKHYEVEGAIWSTTLIMFVLYILPSLFLLKQKSLL